MERGEKMKLPLTSNVSYEQDEKGFVTATILNPNQPHLYRHYHKWGVVSIGKKIVYYTCKCGISVEAKEEEGKEVKT